MSNFAKQDNVHTPVGHRVSAWLRETPYATTGVFHVISGVFAPKGYPLTVMRPRLHDPEFAKYGVRPAETGPQITLFPT